MCCIALHSALRQKHSLILRIMVLFQMSIMNESKVSKRLVVHKYLMLFCPTCAESLRTKTSTYRLYLAPHELLQFFHQLCSLVCVTVFPATKNTTNNVDLRGIGSYSKPQIRGI